MDRAARPFASSDEHLAAELSRVELLLRVHDLQVALTSEHGQWGSSAEERIFALLDARATEAPRPPAVVAARAEAERIATENELHRAESARCGVQLRLSTLAARCELDRTDVDVLLLALACETDRAGPAGRGAPAVGLLLDVLFPAPQARLGARRRLRTGAPLLKYGIVQFPAGEEA